MVRDQPPRPANMLDIVAQNQGRIPSSTELPRPPRLAPADVARAVEAGHVVVDTRPPASFREAHFPSALSAPLSSGSFEQAAGWILPPVRPLLLATDGEDDLRRALGRLAFVGLERRVVGWLDPRDWIAERRATRAVPSIDVRSLRRRLDEGSIRLLDVREPAEWASGHVEPAILASYRTLAGEPGRLLPADDGEIAVICESGLRSTIAASLLLANGHRAVRAVEGGMGAWREAGLPVRGPEGA